MTQGSCVMRALPEYRGKIEEIFLLTFLKSDGTAEQVLETFGGILDAFKKDRKIRILVNFERKVPKTFRSDLAKLFRDKDYNIPEENIFLMSMLDLCGVIRSALLELEPGRTVVDCNEAQLIPATIFAQDPFAVLESDGDLNYLINPIYSHTNFANSYIAQNLADAARSPSYMIRPTLLSFNAANILAGENYILIGKDSVVENQGGDTQDRSELHAQFQAYYGVNHVVEIGSYDAYRNIPHYSQGKYQPVFHLDMFITLAGPVAVEHEMLVEIVFVGELVVYDLDSQAILTEPNPLMKQITQGLDETAHLLDGMAFGDRLLKVVRIPLLLVINNHYGNYLSWNNALVENHWPRESSTVYLPDYCDSLDHPSSYKSCQDQAIARIEGCGFQVKMVSNRFVYYSLNMRGSLHCMAKAIRRSKRVGSIAT
jgi:hypothetical protein